MKWRSLFLLFLFYWVSGTQGDLPGQVESIIDTFQNWELCRRMYLNRDTLCSEGNTHNPNVTSNATLVTNLHQNHSLYYQGESVNITADINDTTSDPNITYTYLLCDVRETDIGNLSSYISSTKSNETSIVSTTTWHFIGQVYLYLFTWDNTGRNGCDYANVAIKKCSDSLIVNVELEQDNSEEGPFQVGNVTVTVNVSSSHANSTDDCPPIDDSSGTGIQSGSAVDPNNTDDTLQYHYTICFPPDIGANDRYCNKTESENSTASLIYDVTGFVESVVYVEVYKASKSKLKYGNDTINITIYEPISNPQVSHEDKDKYIKQKIPITVSASGSTPITVQWEVFHDGHESPKRCEHSSLVLHSNEPGVFYCTFNDSGIYNFNVSFSNTVSYTSKAKQIPIQPSPPINVVATSTSVVAVLVVLIVVVIIIIAVVTSYMSYRKFRNKATETADFSFVKLEVPPTRRQRLVAQISKVKERFGKKRQRFGLVNTDENVDSFYGSLNPFAAHESL
ncbi:PREDICTED: uncharacterized protein LOC100632877 [Amphimedon queenslandica]|uniref:Ig-like domain-containing protein n=1 Tax=Amphimedon queenslandica TaxID=400682 RepID=A0A1X7UT79_AMPQE|nr:PREDICTED: uncharacterized protein LOC100632877 [Amphimedon queenslandica]|eukprot:XP_011404149.1 PREDICTED: uncharacterized protein LOC100632877 [Amphimedon queenslandica]